MRIRKVNSVDVKLHNLTKVKLKTAGNTSVVQFTAGNNKTCTVRNLSKDTYLDVRTGEVKQKKKSEKAKEITEDQLQDLEDETQKLTDKYVAEIEKKCDAKSKDILTV